MLQHSDEDNEQAHQFLQNLTTAVNVNQAAFHTMNDNLQTLQNEVQAMNAAQNTANNPPSNRNNRYNSNVPYNDISRAYYPAPLMQAQGNPQMPSMPYIMPSPPTHQAFQQPPPSQHPTVFQQLNSNYPPRATGHRSNNRNWNNNTNPHNAQNSNWNVNNNNNSNFNNNSNRNNNNHS